MEDGESTLAIRALLRDELSPGLATIRTELKGVTESAAAARIELGRVARASDESLVSSNKLGLGLGGLGRAFSGLGIIAKGTITILAGITKIGLAGFVIGSGLSIKAASDFQAAMARVNTQAGAFGNLTGPALTKAMSDLSSQVITLAPQVGFSPTSLAQGLYHLESAGFRGAQALDLLKYAAEGARVGGADLESTTQAMIAVTASQIKGVSGAADAMAQLNTIVGIGDMRMEGLAQSMSTGILPAAANAGLSLKDVGAAMATITDNTTTPIEAATRLRMTFALMEAPTDKASASLAKIGLSSTQLALDMRQPDGLLVAVGDLRQHLSTIGVTGDMLASDLSKPGGVNVALDDIKSKMQAANISAVDQAAILEKAFGGGRTSGTILTLLGEFDRLKDKYKQLNDGDPATKFAAAWAQTQDSVQQKTAQLGASFDALAVRLGTALLPVAGKVEDSLSGVLASISSVLTGSMQVSAGNEFTGDVGDRSGQDRGDRVGGTQGITEATRLRAAFADLKKGNLSNAGLDLGLSKSQIDLVESVADDIEKIAVSAYRIAASLAPAAERLGIFTAQLAGGTFLGALHAAADVMGFLANHTNLVKGALIALGVIIAARAILTLGDNIANAATRMQKFRAGVDAGNTSFQKSVTNTRGFIGNLGSIASNAGGAAKGMLGLGTSTETTQTPVVTMSDLLGTLDKTLSNLTVAISAMVTSLEGPLVEGLDVADGQLTLFDTDLKVATTSMTQLAVASEETSLQVGTQMGNLGRSGTSALSGLKGSVGGLGIALVGGIAGGYAAGSSGSTGGSLLAAASAAAIGFTVAGPWGAAIGGFASIAATLVGHFTNMKDAADGVTKAIQEQANALTSSYKDSNFKVSDTVKQQLFSQVTDPKNSGVYSDLSNAGITQQQLYTFLTSAPGSAGQNAVSDKFGGLQASTVAFVDSLQSSFTLAIAKADELAKFLGQTPDLTVNNSTTGLPLTSSQVLGQTVTGTVNGLGYSQVVGTNIVTPSAPQVYSRSNVVSRNLGGPIPGSGNSDNVHALLTPGEFVMTQSAAKMYGYDTLHAMNNAPKFANGGKVGTPNALNQMVAQILAGTSGTASGSTGTSTTAAAAVGDGGAASPGQLGNWINQALKIDGQPLSLGAGVQRLIMSESSGVPTAQNNVDINAQRGDPDRGLMQLVSGTFATNVPPSLASRGVFDPVANIAAGVNYAIKNYGAGMLMAGGRHDASGNYVGYDSGGWLEPNAQRPVSGVIPYNRTNRREAVMPEDIMVGAIRKEMRGSSGGDHYTFHTEVNVSGGAQISAQDRARLQSEFDTMVRGAMQRMKDRG